MTKAITFETERVILANTVRKILAAGFAVSVHDGEEAYRASCDMERIMRDATATEETTIRIVDRTKKAIVGAIYYIFGNKGDVLCSYSDNPLTASMIVGREELQAAGADVSWWDE